MKNEMSLVPDTSELQVYQVMAKKADESKYFTKIGGEAGLLSIMLMARELGLPPMQSVMGGMNNIQGKIELSPRLMNAMIRKAGHKVEVLSCEQTHCRLKGTRSDTKETLEVAYSIDDAKRAQIFRAGGPWEKYPDDMCFKSALSKLARRLFADVISTAYIEGEIEESPQQETNKVIEIAPEPVFITEEEAQLIESYFSEDEGDYRKVLLEYYSSKCKTPMEDFSKLPKEHLASILNAFEQRKKKQEEKLVAMAGE